MYNVHLTHSLLCFEFVELTLNLMDKQAMNLIRGGVECKKKYTADSCGCGYTGPSY